MPSLRCSNPEDTQDDGGSGHAGIGNPPHSLQRDERYFPSPLKFMPERWTEEAPEYVVDKRAFLTFSTGAYSCVGQKLAIMEMRAVTANLVRCFDIEFAGDHGKALREETRDSFTVSTGALDVKLTPRHSA